jgi:hypothetical protein
VTPDPDSQWRYVAEHQRFGDRVNRHTLAIALIVAPVTFGALALQALGTDSATFASVLGCVAIPAAVGGWLHPPSRDLRLKGVLGGVAIAIGALVASRVYITWTGLSPQVRVGHQFLLPLIVGGLPGAALYYALVRNHGFSATKRRTNSSGSPRGSQVERGRPTKS